MFTYLIRSVSVLVIKTTECSRVGSLVVELGEVIRNGIENEVRRVPGLP